jgi:hypothetical protein
VVPEVDPTLLCPFVDVLLPYWPFEADVELFEPYCPVEELVLFGFRAVSDVLGFAVAAVEELVVSGFVAVELEVLSRRVLSWFIVLSRLEPSVVTLDDVDPVPPVAVESELQVPLDEVPELLREFWSDVPVICTLCPTCAFKSSVVLSSMPPG